MWIRSQIAARCLAAGMAACALVAAPVRGQIRQTGPEGRLACQALDQANGIRPALASALAGDAENFAKLSQHLGALRTLMDGNPPPSLSRLEPLVRGIEPSAKMLLQKPLVVPMVQNSLREVVRQSLVLVSQAEEVAVNERKGRPVPTRVEAARQLPALLDGLSRQAGRIAGEETSPEAVFEMGRSLNAFRELTRGLADGDAGLKIPAASNAQQRARLKKLMEDFNPVFANAGKVLGNLQEYVAARLAITHIQKVSLELVGGLQRICYVPGIRVEPRS